VLRVGPGGAKLSQLARYLALEHTTCSGGESSEDDPGPELKPGFLKRSMVPDLSPVTRPSAGADGERESRLHLVDPQQLVFLQQ
jgi:hypothetical protein